MATTPDDMTASTKPAEALYSISEIVAAADKVFDGKYTRALILAALRFNNAEDSITITQAKKYVESFASRKVVN